MLHDPQQIIVYHGPLDYYLWNNPAIIGLGVIATIVAVVVAILVANLTSKINQVLRQHTNTRFRLREDWLTVGSAIVTIIVIIYNLGA